MLTPNDTASLRMIACILAAGALCITIFVAFFWLVLETDYRMSIEDGWSDDPLSGEDR